MQPLNILQVGLGGFGKNHLRTWHELGFGGRLFVAELDANRHEDCRKYNLPPEHLTRDHREFLDRVDIVDIVTPTTSHFDLCSAALRAGKDVFVEKPMTMTSAEAGQLEDLVAKTGRLLQVGYYYRFHPLSQYTKSRLEAGELGSIRYLSGNFMGFKRARTDVGVTHTDGIHFLDLFNWLLGAFPLQVYAVVRDHFGRGLEDFSVVLLTYPGRVVAKVESGYIQPGKWKDKVVPHALTTKEIAVMGAKATLELDFETETLSFHDVRHELRDGIWTAVNGGSRSINAGTATTVEQIGLELTDFLDCVRTRRKPSANVHDSGVVLAHLMEAIYESGRQNRPVPLAFNSRENMLERHYGTRPAT